jgi:hypothetical protein
LIARLFRPDLSGLSAFVGQRGYLAVSYPRIANRLLTLPKNECRVGH